MNKVASSLFAIALAACAGDKGPYPSLAPRPAEKIGFEEPPAPVPEAVRADSALDQKLATTRSDLAAAAGAFEDAAGNAERLTKAARGAAVGSERWIAAQSALAGLDTMRADLTSIVTTLDGYAIDRAAKLESEYPTLQALRAEATRQAEVAAQRIDALTASLPSA